jgi:hypothetical protein
MSSPYQAFADVSCASIAIKNLSQNKGGKGQSCFIDYSDPKFARAMTAPKDLRVLWNVKPSGENVEDAFSFNLELGLPPQGERKDVDDFRSKATEVDMLILNFALKNKVDFFGSQKAKSMSSVDVVRGAYTPFIKEGKEAKEGAKYDDSIHGKVYGWKDYVDHIVYKDCTVKGVPNTKMVDNVVWKPRICDPSGRMSNFKEGDTRFYLFMGKDPVTNTDTYTERVPITDATGRPVQDERNNLQYRWVGPGDCMRGSKATVVFQMSKLYVAASFGPINAIREVYIKPAPPRERGVLGGAKIVQVVDPLQAARALQALMNSEEPEEEEEDSGSTTHNNKAKDEEVDSGVVQEEEVVSERVHSSSSSSSSNNNQGAAGGDKKRKKAESGDESSHKKKKSSSSSKALSELPENDL